ncbi:hypothetical protein SORBI_3008G138300 [Sorghum bicolor]|uniref:Late embryogenesis abundant protein LEA-2 subgroup domain-containing protein n=1 Tax=Sorghum bicolor TaxID=4558 RepID=C5YQA3_SORBI|nr:hypothetical protein SORBI_3008G138300 [Sorghum bicolor]
MTAKPPHLLVDVPPSGHDGGGGGRQRREWRNQPACRKACAVSVLVLLGAALITGLTYLFIFLNRQFPEKDPVFTVAITGVTGLDPAVDLPPSLPAADDDDDGYSSISSPTPTPALSPVFNLTFRIDNTRNAYHEACVPGLSRAEVSYGDAFLAGGSVPPFCAGEKRASDQAARAWGENVAVPRFLREQLAAELAAGDASVDVKVTMPSYCWNVWCGGAVLTCKPKIGGGPSPACRLDRIS